MHEVGSIVTDSIYVCKESQYSPSFLELPQVLTEYCPCQNVSDLSVYLHAPSDWKLYLLAGLSNSGIYSQNDVWCFQNG